MKKHIVPVQRKEMMNLNLQDIKFRVLMRNMEGENKAMVPTKKCTKEIQV